MWRHHYSICASEVSPALEFDVYDVNGAAVWEPGNEYYQFNSTDFDKSTYENNDWK